MANGPDDANDHFPLETTGETGGALHFQGVSST